VNISKNLDVLLNSGRGREAKKKFFVEDDRIFMTIFTKLKIKIDHWQFTGTDSVLGDIINEHAPLYLRNWLPM
jgi:hypothetical protein